MAFVKSTLLSVAFAVVGYSGAMAQTADSHAALKTEDQIKYHDFESSSRKFTYDAKFNDGTLASVSFQEWHDDPRARRVELLDLKLNGVLIPGETFEAINKFMRDELYSVRPETIRCVIYGDSATHGRLSACEEVRIKFTARFRDTEKFTYPETDIFNPTGTCSIFIQVRARDASIWCYGDSKIVAPPLPREDSTH